MPNWVAHKVTVRGDSSLISTFINAIKGEDCAFDFNKIAPMPESLNMASGGITDEAIVAYVTNNGECQLSDELICWCKDCGVTNMFADDYINKTFDRVKKMIKENGVDKKYSFASGGFGTEAEPMLTLYDAGKIYVENVNNYGCTTWYDWARQNWGTKWQPSEVIVERDGDNGVYMEFSTAWSTPFPIFEKLSTMFPTLDVKVLFADEDIPCNCGMYAWENGEFSEWVPERNKKGEFIDEEGAIRFACSVWDFDADEYLSECELQMD